MPNIEHGFTRAITEILGGLVVASMLNSFVSSGLLDSSMLVLYELLNILAIFAFIHVSLYWGTGYLIGWWFGLGIMCQAGLVSAFEFTLYSILVTIVLVKRIAKHVIE